MIEKYQICVTEERADAIYVRKRLGEFNSVHVRDDVRRGADENTFIVLKDDRGTVMGGIIGYFYWNCLHIDILWVDEQLRGKGKGKELLQFAEKMAKEKGCTLIKLDTFEFQAPEFYKKQGYEIYGVLENFPEGSNHYYMCKRL